MAGGLQLLTADEKRVFFSRLEDLLRTKKPRRPAIGKANHAEVDILKKVVVDPNGARLTFSTIDTSKEASKASMEKPKEKEVMRDFTKLGAMNQGKRAASRKTQGPVTKMQKRSPSAEINTGKKLLQDQRVLLVPIGPDVSRRRVEIWQDQVEKLGGSAVHVDMKANKKTRSGNGTPVVDWNTVDLIVASSELASEKAAEVLLLDKFPPENIEACTPDWLVYLLKEKKRPPEKSKLTWSGQQEAREQEEKEEKRREEIAQRIAEQHACDNEASSDESDEGSNAKNSGSRHIMRASPAEVDAAKFCQQQDELNAKRIQLVQERTPIFYKNNPGFRPLNESAAPGSKRVSGEGFICQHSSAILQNFNAHLTDPLEEMLEYFAVERDVWREYMYKKIISSLKALRHRVSSAKDLKDLHWVKGRLRDKVIELLETGRISKLDAKKSNEGLRALVKIARIWGVGPATAAKLYSKGYKTLDDLRTPEGTAELTAQQQIGLKHYQDFLTKIPRAEAQQIEKTVVDEVHKMIPNAQAQACGSYRRGKSACGDVDVLITDPDAEQCGILPELLERLHATGFLTDDLTHFSKQHTGGCDTYMGVCRVSEGLPYRRIDIKVYPRRYFGFAILYFTGSDHFNRSMRLFANKNGWTLSDRELTQVMRVNGLKVKQGESVICESEVDVFIALGLEYKDPTERNCFNIKFLDEDEASAKKNTFKSTTAEDE
ncbi:hypothetical protein PHYBOEH_005480 [Phytophthora boehmeriae]|uniref:DNA-directed DNA polymerase n=1 Tax=Phytophthora boehmeriae TaxID=109152 RepID=A0A8T1WLN9_9STRA|nr:hypothetical protein PHYBOEH_005480 [Phytophthora boehmeriae]